MEQIYLEGGAVWESCLLCRSSDDAHQARKSPRYERTFRERRGRWASRAGGGDDQGRALSSLCFLPQFLQRMRVTCNPKSTRHLLKVVI